MVQNGSLQWGVVFFNLQVSCRNIEKKKYKNKKINFENAFHLPIKEKNEASKDILSWINKKSLLYRMRIGQM